MQQIPVTHKVVIVQTSSSLEASGDSHNDNLL